MNFRDFVNIVTSAQDIGMDQISFLAADVSSTAFNHPPEMAHEQKEEITLSIQECDELALLLKESIHRLKDEFRSGFIAESPDKIMELVQHYRAFHGQGHFPRRRCNAPWVSAVIEPNGDVLPCFFHPPYGNIYDEPFEQIINSSKAIRFRQALNIADDPTCAKCVCSLKVGILQQL
jgi:MoaA/NifB/PqqE/SkfB family radical SAM enzyme